MKNEAMPGLTPELDEMDRALEDAARREIEQSPALSDRFRVRLEQRLCEADESDATARIVPVAGRRRIAWIAGAAAAVVAVAVAGLAVIRTARPVGEMLFTEGRTAAQAAGDSLTRGEQLSTSSGERMIASLDSRVTLSLNAESGVRIESRDRLAFEAGEIWVHVKPGSGRFTIDMGERTRLEVIGTSFTVKQTPGGYEVAGYDGTVKLMGGGRSVEVKRGNHSHVDGATGAPSPPEAMAGTEPEWTTALISRYYEANLRTYFPSVRPVKK